MINPSQKIRPSSRLLRTIGQDLIKDVYAAIVELVKNAYDADSSFVLVSFLYIKSQRRLVISVKDEGEGMSFDTVISKWLVPATDDKLTRKTSKKGRVLQGRKGIGRFSASVLGDRMLLETTKNKKKTSLILDMEEINKVEFLDEVSIDVNVEKTKDKNGTLIEIEKDGVTAKRVAEIWTPKQINKLLVELRSLISPEGIYQAAASQGYKISHDAFKIDVEFKDFPIDEFSNRSIDVVPFPVLDLYDYRISGTVNQKGKAKLRFENQNIPSLPAEEFQLELALVGDESRKNPGDVYIDLRVYDRDPDSIANIIQRGLKDPDTGEYVGKAEARAILDEHYGVGIYREQFRIRPYGEQSFDWLDLDKKRVQDPSRKIGHNQIIGFVYVRPEEKSGLTEKSARDGLTENSSYYGLNYIVSRFVNQLETRRFLYREKAQKGGRRKPIEFEVDDLFNFDHVSKSITKNLDQMGLPQKQREKVGQVVTEALDSEKEKKSVVAKKLQDAIVMYQGQATLGKITHVLLHEGRKHIKYISETIPRIVTWSRSVAGGDNKELIEKIADRGDKVVSHAKGISFLFKKIEPLARTRRSPPKKLKLGSVLDNSFDIFTSELEEQKISCDIRIDDEALARATVLANEMDMLTVFSNLIENSIYWHSHNKKRGKKIEVDIYLLDDNVVLDYTDNGPGFQGDNLELMFEPGYSMKPDGTGLGLALAGEAMARIGGEIVAMNSNKGAAFQIVFKGQEL